MKKRLTLLLCATLLLSGCADSPEPATTATTIQTSAPPETEPTDGLPDYKITLSIENVQPDGTGLTLVATQHDTPYAWPPYAVSFAHNHYTLEYLDGEQWIRLLLPPYGGVDIMWSVGNGQTKQWELKWPGDHALPNGTYRILEDCFIDQPVWNTKTGKYDNNPVRTYYTDPFEITQSADPHGIKLFSSLYDVKNGYSGLTCYRFPGGVTGELSGDDSFWLESWTGTEWELIEPLNPYPFTGTVITVPVNDLETARWQLPDFDLTEVYGDLPKGDYRVGKTFQLSDGGEVIVYDYKERGTYGFIDTTG